MEKSTMPVNPSQEPANKGRLQDQVAVITGAGRGIGRAIALAMSEQGAGVVVNDLGGSPDGLGESAGPADEVVHEIQKQGGEAVANYDTVATHEGGERIIQTAMHHFGRMDILVNNAGILRQRMIFNMTPDEWDAVIRVHLYGVFNCTRPASALMRKQKRGRIINMSSVSGLGMSGQANYCAAKEGIIGFTRAVARDMGWYGVTCNAVRPGALTRLTTTDDMPSADKLRKTRGIGIQSGEAGDPEDVAPFIVWLCTDAAARINGYDFDVGKGHVGLYSQPHQIKTIYKDGRWTLKELDKLVPKVLAADLSNPSPPAKTT